MSFDYEQVQQLTYHIIAFDQGEISKTATATVHINILDQNDEAPHFTLPYYVMSVAENEAPGTEVGQVAAVDKDSSLFNEFYFDFLSSDDEAAWFLEQESGRIFTKVELDREATPQLWLRIKAYDKVNPALYSVVNVTINVSDENDNVPLISFPNSENHTLKINPDAHRNSVTAIIATDKDIGVNAELSYYVISGDDDNVFLLDEHTGILYINSMDKVAERSGYSLRIEVRDGGAEPLSNQTVLNIDIVAASEFMAVNAMILTIVGVLSAVIIAVLIVAIVLLKRRDCLGKKAHQKAKTDATRPSHQYYTQPGPINTSQESVSDYSAYDGHHGGKFVSSLRDVSADTGSHDTSDVQLRYHANPITGQHTQVIHC